MTVSRKADKNSERAGFPLLLFFKLNICSDFYLSLNPFSLLTLTFSFHFKSFRFTSRSLVPSKNDVSCWSSPSCSLKPDFTVMTRTDWETKDSHQAVINNTRRFFWDRTSIKKAFTQVNQVRDSFDLIDFYAIWHTSASRASSRCWSLERMQI